MSVRREIPEYDGIYFITFSSQSYSFRELCAYEQLIIFIDFNLKQKC